MSSGGESNEKYKMLWMMTSRVWANFKGVFRQQRTSYHRLFFFLGRDVESLLLFQKIYDKRRTKRLKLYFDCAFRLLTCNFHLAGDAVLLAAGGDRLILDRHALVVLLLRIHFLDMVIVSKLRKLALEGGVLCNWVEALYVIQSVNFRHFVARHFFPLVVSLDSAGLSRFKIKFPPWWCFWFAAGCFHVSKIKITMLWYSLELDAGINLLFQFCFIRYSK